MSKHTENMSKSMKNIEKHILSGNYLSAHIEIEKAIEVYAKPDSKETVEHLLRLKNSINFETRVDEIFCIFSKIKFNK